MAAERSRRQAPGLPQTREAAAGRATLLPEASSPLALPRLFSEFFEAYCAPGFANLNCLRLGRLAANKPLAEHLLAEVFFVLGEGFLEHCVGADCYCNSIAHFEAVFLAEVLDSADKVANDALVLQFLGYLGIESNSKRALV